MLEFIVVVSIIISLSEMVKKIGLVDVKLIPLLDLVFGVVILIAYENGDFDLLFIKGILAGIFACGVFSGCKNICEKLFIVD